MDTLHKIKNDVKKKQLIDLIQSYGKYAIIIFIVIINLFITYSMFSINLHSAIFSNHSYPFNLFVGLINSRLYLVDIFCPKSRAC